MVEYLALATALFSINLFRLAVFDGGAKWFDLVASIGWGMVLGATAW